MGESILCRNLIEVPTDFLTREAFRINVRERDLLPPPGFIKYPIKGAGLWGVHGGLEKLPMLATVPSTKIHGIIKEIHDSKHKPCVITSITIPGEKAEDEKDLLPLIRRNIESARLPECLYPNLYTSHISKFEVFPRFDPVYSQYDGISRRTLKQEIGPATQNALDKLSNVLYRKSLYETDFQPFGPGKESSLNLPGIENQETSNQRRPGVSTKVSEATGCEKELPTDIAATGVTEKDEDEEEEEEEKDYSSWKEKVKKAKAKWLYEKRNASNVLPTRSPYQKPRGNNTGFLTSITLPQCLQDSSLGSSTKAVSFESLACSKAIQKVAMAKKLGDVGSIVRLPSVPGGMPKDIRLSSLGAMICDLPQYTDESLHQQRRKKLPLMVGMRFKTDAHVKFHKEHPEPIPDLRDSIIDGKKHVFFGAHATLLR